MLFQDSISIEMHGLYDCLQAKQDFLAMLEQSHRPITEHAQWKKVKGWFDHDPQYKAVDSSSKREEYFKEYVATQKDKVQVCYVEPKI